MSTYEQKLAIHWRTELGVAVSANGRLSAKTYTYRRTGAIIALIYLFKDLVGSIVKST